MKLADVIAAHPFPVSVHLTNWSPRTHLVLLNNRIAELHDYFSNGELFDVSTHPVYPECWEWDNWELYSEQAERVSQ